MINTLRPVGDFFSHNQPWPPCVCFHHWLTVQLSEKTDSLRAAYVTAKQEHRWHEADAFALSCLKTQTGSNPSNRLLQRRGSGQFGRNRVFENHSAIVLTLRKRRKRCALFRVAEHFFWSLTAGKKRFKMTHTGNSPCLTHSISMLSSSSSAVKIPMSYSRKMLCLDQWSTSTSASHSSHTPGGKTNREFDRFSVFNRFQ